MTNWWKKSAVPVGLALGAVILAGGRSSVAQTLPASDSPAGYLVFPKVIVSVSGGTGLPQIDTFIQLTNTSRVAPRVVQCFYVDASDWTPHDFTLELTPGQPTAWSVREGSSGCAGADFQCPKIAARGDQFVGELKCVEVDQFNVPVPIPVNDLKGEATIYTVTAGTPGSVDVRSYNAIGLQAVNVSTTQPPASIGRQCQFGTDAGKTCTSDTQCTSGQCGVTMCLGATAGSTECAAADYVSCPATLILNNFFDHGHDPVTGKEILTNITFVPCTEDLINASADAQPATKLQFLIFNEFEQRMSTATQVQCYKDTPLSNIDQKKGSEAASVFNVNVQGTLVGQTRIRPVQVPSDTTQGHGILAIAEESHGGASVAVNLNETGLNTGRGDFVRYIHAQ